MGLELGKLSTKSAQDCSESSICIAKFCMFGAPLEDEVGKICARLQPELDFALQIQKNSRGRSTVGKRSRKSALIHRVIDSLVH